MEIAAILVAGVWAFTRFWEDVRPSLVPRADLNSTLGWEQVTEGQCQAEYTVQFQNIGTIPITLAASRLSVWYMSEPSRTGTNPLVDYIDPMVLRQEPALYSSPNGRLIGEYAPTTKDTEGFSFVVQNAKGKQILFETEIWNDRDAAKSPRPDATWRDFRWDTLCGNQEHRLNR